MVVFRRSPSDLWFPFAFLRNFSDELPKPLQVISFWLLLYPKVSGLSSEMLVELLFMVDLIN